MLPPTTSTRSISHFATMPGTSILSEEPRSSTKSNWKVLVCTKWKGRQRVTARSHASLSTPQRLHNCWRFLTGKSDVFRQKQLSWQNGHETEVLLKVYTQIANVVPFYSFDISAIAIVRVVFSPSTSSISISILASIFRLLLSSVRVNQFPLHFTVYFISL